MADDKIKISWDEVQSPQVNLRIKQQQMLERAQEHYQQQAAQNSSYAAPIGTTTPVMPHAPAQGASIWYNSVLYMAVFGIVGGLAAWISGEIVMLAVPNKQEELFAAMARIQAIADSVTRGEITQTQGESAVAQIERKYQDNPYVRIYTNESLTDAEKQSHVEEQLRKDKTRNSLQQLIWFSSLGIPLAFFLAIGDQVLGRNWRGLVINGSIGMALGLLGGVIVGSFVNTLYQSLGGGQTEKVAQQVMARAIGWAILGLFLSVAPGVVLRNWKRFSIGLAGGFAGGLLGGLLFDLLGGITNSVVVSRFVAIVAIGVITGVGTGLIEKAAKSGWVRVVAGLITGKQFIIYKNPTYIGSSPQCEIYLFKDTRVGPRHAAIHTVPGGYEIEDLRSPTGTFVNGHPVSRVRLHNNDQMQIGATAFQFQEKPRAM